MKALLSRSLPALLMMLSASAALNACQMVALRPPVAGLSRVSAQTADTLYPHSSLSREDDSLLEDLSHRSFAYFFEQADPETGLVLDRAHTDGSSNGERIASTAATGFGLTALCIATERGWVQPAVARERVLRTLRFLLTRVPQEHGWMPHFIDQKTGERRWQSEYSSIDTALLLAGVLSARGYFRDDAEIVALATQLYQRTDFVWMLNGHPGLLSHGWTPEHGFIPTRWDTYSEHLILQMLGLGSPTHPLPPPAWRAWQRTGLSYGGYTYLNSGPLFTHQFSQSWLDLRHLHDSVPPYTDFFANSVKATRAHKAFNLELSREFPGYSDTIWGITASDSARGYVAWGGPPRSPEIDGTVVPCAAAGSLMFSPEITIPALRAMQTRYGAKIYGRYSFTDAFNPTTGWVNPDVIGIDLGVSLLSAENLRSGHVWQWFMRNPEIGEAYRAAGLKAG
ncbi:MAG: glucoamylase family protein [Candidatus Sericytochromatia bacterium]